MVYVLEGEGDERTVSLFKIDEFSEINETKSCKEEPRERRGSQIQDEPAVIKRKKMNGKILDLRTSLTPPLKNKMSSTLLSYI